MLALTMVPRIEMNTTSSDGSPKLSRGETELRKCLSNDDTDEILLKSYACAWQKEILVQGHLHITPNHFCFYSTLLSRETKMDIKVRDVISIKKDKTAHLFPNAIVISTADKKYGFSTFAHRNKTFNILQLVWQNALSEQPAPQQHLAARIKLLKNKSKSVGEISPVTTPKHGRKPVWQLSLRGSSKNGITDSESSGTDSPILLSQNNTPSPSPASSFSTLPALTNTATSGTIPRVTVTTSETSESHTHQSEETIKNSKSFDSDLISSNSSNDGIFVDAPDGDPNEYSNSNLNSDSTSVVYDDIAKFSNSNTSDTESEVHQKKKPRSPSVVGLSDRFSMELMVDEDGMVRERGAESREDGLMSPMMPEEMKGISALNQILGTVHIHPTRIGLWRLQAGLHKWCTPSNFINLLIIVSIFLLLISTASMVCKLSYVSPSFQPLLAWQPWCKLCRECGNSKTLTNAIDGDFGRASIARGDVNRGKLWTVASFEELVKRRESEQQINEYSSTGKEASNTHQRGEASQPFTTH